MKRAQGLQFETIIIAVLLIGILIIIGALIANKSQIFGKQTFDCTAQDAVCLESTAKCLAQNGQPIQFSCPKDKPACCKL